MNDLEQRLSQIKNLKETYMIGSADAFKYIKARNYFSQLRKEALDGSGKDIGKLELTNAVYSFFYAYQGALDSLSTVQAFEKGMNPRDCNLQYPGPNKKNEKTLQTDMLWDFDYSTIAQLFTSYFKGNSEIELQNTFLETLKESQKYPLLEFEGKTYSFSQLINDKTGMFSTDFGYPSEQSVYEHSKEYLEEFLGAKTPDRMIAVEFFARPDYEIEYLFGHKTDADTDDIYDRAMKEYTLNRIDVEKRIALNYVLTSSFLTKTINPITDNLKTRIARQKSNLENFEKNEAPSVIIKNSKALIKKYEYIFRSIRKNQKWLEQILSH